MTLSSPSSSCRRRQERIALEPASASVTSLWQVKRLEGHLVQVTPEIEIRVEAACRRLLRDKLGAARSALGYCLHPTGSHWSAGGDLAKFRQCAGTVIRYLEEIAKAPLDESKKAHKAGEQSAPSVRRRGLHPPCPPGDETPPPYREPGYRGA